MHSFYYRNGELFCERMPVRQLAARHGTPLYVYSRQTVAGHFQKLDAALARVDHRICFAVKANSNLALLGLLAGLGAGFDIVSQGELGRVIAAGGDPAKCVFAGVGKTEAEIEFALRRKIYCLNAESEPELARINRVAARLRQIAPVAVRINPGVDAHTHAKIRTGTYEDKFGIQLEQVEGVYARAARLKNLRWRGIQMHIGSQLTSVAPFEMAVKKVLPLVRRLAERHGLEFFSIGGGLGIVYQFALASGSPEWWQSPAARGLLTPASYGARLEPLLLDCGLRILLEPGRFIVGNAGILVTRVEYVKQTGRKHFVIVDAAMNDLIRPAFYDAYHEIVPVSRRPGPLVRSDVVGPVCESGDFFCKGRLLPKAREGDYLAVLSAGAYGFVMASNYNTRPLAAEVLVDRARAAVVRRRQRLEEIWALEKVPEWVR
ncbi:MAG: diaminopimelate decarboxylase [Verrucomicrobiota bacterium]|jgi:diaminopimelate decarboxylase